MKCPEEEKEGGEGEESTIFKGFSISIISNKEIKIRLKVNRTEKKNTIPFTN